MQDTADTLSSAPTSSLPSEEGSKVSGAKQHEEKPAGMYLFAYETFVTVTSLNTGLTQRLHGF